MMKLEANIEAVIFRQSVQWQRNVSTKPGPLVGYDQSCINIDAIYQFPHHNIVHFLLTKASWTAPQ